MNLRNKLIYAHSQRKCLHSEYSTDADKYGTLFSMKDTVEQNVRHVGKVMVRFPRDNREVGLERFEVVEDGRQPTAKVSEAQPFISRRVPSVFVANTITLLVDGTAQDDIFVVSGKQLAMVFFDLLHGFRQLRARVKLAALVQRAMEEVYARIPY